MEGSRQTLCLCVKPWGARGGGGEWTGLVAPKPQLCLPHEVHLCIREGGDSVRAKRVFRPGPP